jgi:glyoxylase I family protein
MTGLTPLLEVFDMDESLKFYVDCLGFEIVNMAPKRGWCMLRSGRVTLMLNTAHEDDERPAGPPLERKRWHRDLTLYFDADPDVAYGRLKACGYMCQEPYKAPYGVVQANAADPDGYSTAFIRQIEDR